MEIPFSIPESQVQGYISHMAGSPYFAEGVEAYMTTFLTSNASSRAAIKPWRICQHQCLVGINFGEFCYWLDEVEDGANSPRYEVWAVNYPSETPQISWFKFIFRSFRPLLHNLRTVGLGSEYMHYEVVLGDPGYAILIDPFVSFAMVVDIWCGATYAAMAVFRVTQFQDMLSYALGSYIFHARFGLLICACVASLQSSSGVDGRLRLRRSILVF
ncbi:hypothetical protein AeRB84_007588 [Aphanomyces euteiches]|nr:hypothetical protein AeRB84_007588 [Aphanomyces euteiches]